MEKVHPMEGVHYMEKVHPMKEVYYMEEVNSMEEWRKNLPALDCTYADRFLTIWESK